MNEVPCFYVVFPFGENTRVIDGPVLIGAIIAQLYCKVRLCATYWVTRSMGHWVNM